jgi:hypothetical protein
MPTISNLLRWAGTYLTGEEIWGEPVTPEELETTLQEISVFDLLRIVGSLSVSLRLRPDANSPQSQAALATLAIGDDPDLVKKLEVGLGRGQVLIFEQQLYHLARLAILDSDRRRPTVSATASSSPATTGPSSASATRWRPELTATMTWSASSCASLR